MRVTKSAPLLSVSSPLPPDSSAPPMSILAPVERLLAFRSMLVPASGDVVALVSLSRAVPIPTLSTSSLSASRKTTVLFAVIPLLEVAG